MAEFEPAVDFVLSHEGGYACNEADPGGETNFGISKREFPSCDVKNLTVEMAREFYRTHYWDRGRFAEFRYQSVANKVFDLWINTGPSAATKILQLACGDCRAPVTVDGVMGSVTLAMANGVSEFSLLNALKNRAVSHYQRLVAEDQNLAEFLGGWIKRANA